MPSSLGVRALASTVLGNGGIAGWPVRDANLNSRLAAGFFGTITGPRFPPLWIDSAVSTLSLLSEMPALWHARQLDSKIGATSFSTSTGRPSFTDAASIAFEGGAASPER